MNDLNQKTCNSTPGCHVQWSSASSAYDYLNQSGCLPSLGCVAGMGGSPANMPLFGGMVSAQGIADCKAWVAAGAQNN